MVDTISNVNAVLSNFAPRWNSDRLATLFSENKEQNSDCRIQHALQFKFGTIIPKPETKVDKSLIEMWKKYTVVNPGDIMINGLNLNYDFISLRIGLVKETGIITSAYISLKPREGINSSYYNYYFKALDSQKVFHGFGTGIRLTLSYKELKNVILPIPPRDEQDKIVRYLDWQVSKINKLIAAKKKEIARVGELKKTIVNEAVTHGLNPNVPMKFSGVEWLGDIPEHWETRKIKFTFSERSEKGYPNESLLVASQNKGVVPKNIYGSRTVEAMKDLHLLKLVRVGDFVISLRSFQGGIEYAYYQGIISPAYTIMIPKKIINSGYFKYLAKSFSFIELLKLCVTGIREGQNIDYQKLKNHMIPLPPRSEQAQIVHYLERKTSKLNSFIETTQKQITTLQEIKNKLISDVVTGQIDVRGVEVPDFEYVEEESEDGSAADDEQTEELNDEE